MVFSAYRSNHAAEAKRNRGWTSSLVPASFKRMVRSTAIRRCALAIFLACALVLSAAIPGGTSAAGTLVQKQEDKPIGDIIIHPNPVISGSIGGSVSFVPVPNAFAVTFNFGELSPMNQNLVVTIAITVTVRVSRNYQIRLSMGTPSIPDPNAIQLTDIGIGIQNLQLLGPGLCAGAIQAPYDNNPATAMTINPTTFRATYPTTLSNVDTSSPIVIRGPSLPSQGASFQVIMVAAPQFFTPGSTSFTFTLALQAGSSFSCL
ncbi:MAG: hypothetical protein L0229_10330 [Blastocatellia bacterium]|nr:hypothetical protein [Blastocatellia bacterium]